MKHTCPSVVLAAILSGCAPSAPDVGASPPVPREVESGKTKAAGGVNGDYNYCADATAPCDAGEGDCDADADCAAGLVCGVNNGAGYTFSAGTDVCWPTHCEDGVLSGDEVTADHGGSCSRLPPTAAVVGPLTGDEVGGSAALQVAVDDGDDATVQVTVYGRVTPTPGADFSLVALPDTQWYACGCSRLDSTPQTFYDQTGWIAANVADRNIAFVTHLGDITEHGDDDVNEWLVADAAMATLEDALATGLPEGLPYGVAVGNHDQSPRGDAAGTTTYFNQFFGTARFAGRGYYGGHHGSDNDNSFQLFEASGVSFVVVHLEYDMDADPAVLDWASDVIGSYPDRLAIVVSHRMLDADGVWEQQGARTYDALQHHPNLVMFLAGHVPGESRRTDVSTAGQPIHSMLADYQSRDHGGDGWMRVLTFSPAAGQVHVQTYSPTLDAWEVDDDSDFTVDIDLTRYVGWEALGTVEVAPGDVASWTWDGLDASVEHAWYAVVDDGRDTVTTPIQTLAPGSCHAVDPGHGAYCSEACPCEDGEGDCDNDSQCVDGTTCVANVGAEYGFGARIDVCQASCHVQALWGGAYCSPDCPCAEGEGDCDTDADCAPGLSCAMNVGAAYGQTPQLDVCEATCHSGPLGGAAYCSPGCPCGDGEGDCDTDADCDAGLTCSRNVGATYGYAAHIDVCEGA